VDEEQATGDFVFVLKGDSRWAVELVGRYHDVLNRDDESRRFHSRGVQLVG
jgi:hypothetical protein